MISNFSYSVHPRRYLEFVTNRSQEGAQFVKGFGGIGGLLRYKVDFTNLASVDDEAEDEFMSDDEDL